MYTVLNFKEIVEKNSPTNFVHDRFQENVHRKIKCELNRIKIRLALKTYILKNYIKFVLFFVLVLC